MTDENALADDRIDGHPADAIEAEEHPVAVDDRLAMAELENAPFTGSPGIGDFVSESHGHRGAIVVDEGAARASGCIGYALNADKPEEADLVFVRHGAVGALSKDQQAQFCPTVELRPLSDRQKSRLRAFKESTQVCKREEENVPKGERLEPWMSCMTRELRSRGERL